MRKALLPWVLMLSIASCAQAQDPATDTAAVAKSEYIELAPSFVANFGGPGQLHYLKADIVVRVNGGESGAQAVRHHMPQLRHQLVMLLSRQTSEDIATMDGREQLRQQALTEVQEVLFREEGATYVDDLLFNGFIVQR